MCKILTFFGLFFVFHDPVWGKACYEQYVVADIEMQPHTFQYTEHGTFFAMPDHFGAQDQIKVNSLCQETFGQKFTFRPEISVSQISKKNAILDFAVNTLGMDLSFIISRQLHSVKMIRTTDKSIFYGCSMKLPAGSLCNENHLRQVSRRPASLSHSQSLANLSFSGLSMQQSLPLQYMD